MSFLYFFLKLNPQRHLSWAEISFKVAILSAHEHLNMPWPVILYFMVYFLLKLKAPIAVDRCNKYQDQYNLDLFSCLSTFFVTFPQLMYYCMKM